MNPAAKFDRPLLAKDLTREIIGCFYRVHDGLGFGFLESVYRRALAHELGKRGHRVRIEAPIDVWYDGANVGHFRADLIVGETVLVELKASPSLCAADHAQLLNYLRGSELEVGLLLHFGPRPAFHRFVHGNARKRRRSREDR